MSLLFTVDGAEPAGGCCFGSEHRGTEMRDSACVDGGLTRVPHSPFYTKKVHFFWRFFSPHHSSMLCLPACTNRFISGVLWQVLAVSYLSCNLRPMAGTKAYFSVIKRNYWSLKTKRIQQFLLKQKKNCVRFGKLCKRKRGLCQKINDVKAVKQFWSFTDFRTGTAKPVRRQLAPAECCAN